MHSGDGTSTVPDAVPRAKASGTDAIKFVVVCVLFFVLFAVHEFRHSTPKIALVFDSLAYLDTTAKCMHLLSSPFISGVGNYVASGFNPSQRLPLSAQMESAEHLIRCGPVLPAIIGAFYAIAGKMPSFDRWQIGAIAMMIVQSLTAGVAFLLARECWGRKAATISVLLLFLYGAFTINAPRLMSEIPAAFTLVLWCLLTVKFFAEDRERPRMGALKGLLYGASTVLLMLSRPTFLPVPFVSWLVIWISARVRKVELRLPGTFIAFTTVAMLCVLAPWAVCEKIMTNRFAITVDRFGAYNLFTGTDVSADGLDVLPSDFVEHPQNFKMSWERVLSSIGDEVQRDPLGCASLAMRKPARLVDSPWNDFQNKFFFVGWTLQKWYHQILMILAATGVFECIDKMWRRRRFGTPFTKADIITLLLSTVSIFSIANCLFITMRRYLFPAIPLLVVAGAVPLVRRRSSVERADLLIWAAFLPTACTLVTAGQQRWLMQWLCKSLGISIVSYVVPVLLVLILLASFWNIGRLLSFTSPVWRSWLALGVISSASLYIGAFHELSVVEQDSELGSAQLRLPISRGLIGRRCFLVFDVYGLPAESSGTRKFNAYFNGQVLDGNPHPWLETDASQRTSFEYLRVFATSKGLEPDSLRQWWCLEIPQYLVAAAVRNGKPATVALSGPCHFASDFRRNGALQHSLSLRSFSWTKGFFVNEPGEMRMDEWHRQAVDSSDKQKLIPRAAIIAVEDQHEQPKKVICSARLPDTEITRDPSQRLVSYTVPVENFGHRALEAIAKNNAVNLRITGMVRATGNGAMPSITLWETRRTASGELLKGFAPEAPSHLACSKDWQLFEFEDLLPLTKPDGTRAKLQELQISLAGNPWWDVFQYCLYKPTANIQFKKLRIEIWPGSLPNLDKQPYRRIDAAPGLLIGS